MNLNDSMFQLLNYVEKENYKGYDPYDLKGLDWYVNYLNETNNEDKSFIKKIEELNYLYPKQLRGIFKIEPRTNAKGLALFILSYCNLYHSHKDSIYLDKAKKLVEELLLLRIEGFKGYCWGYPFDWKSSKEYFFKEGTPSIVVTTTVGKAFLELYKYTEEKTYLEVCKSIASFLTGDLKRTVYKDTFCFSYTPFDTYQIHNANLMGAEFLSFLGKILNNSEYMELSRKSAYFTINQQNMDGCFYYFGDNSNDVAPTHLDIYHSGFEIRSLVNLYMNLEDEFIRQSFLKYMDFFISQYIIEEKIPKLGPRLKNYETDIVDVHGLAEAILTLNVIKEFIPEAKYTLKNVISWGIEHMQSSEGWFNYRWVRNGDNINEVRFPYMRWGQAWMMFALSSIVRD